MRSRFAALSLFLAVSLIWLERFYAEFKNKQGEDYEPENLKVMVLSLSNGFTVIVIP